MQVTVLSGKGGTGKTTIAVGIAETIKNSIKIDCDVDAANMYLYYKGKQTEKESFYSGKTARINSDKCIRCGKCFRNCKFDAIKDYKVDSLKCEGCGICKLVCPVGAIEMFDNHVADIIEEKIKNGNLIRADMEIGADGSGRLITKLRSKVKNNNEIIIVDGSPGIGCPVISSVTDTDFCLIVTEPTLSGLNDLERLLELINSFKIKSLVCINKYDINCNMTEKVKDYCKERNIEIIGLIPYDDMVIKSINDLKPIISYQTSRAGREIKKIAEKIFKIYKEEYL
ncbi:MAG TPA: ATP-binding protein [Bacilli bacterium]|nr:ATP-binding protein [Bacilli bacterium]